MKTNSLSSPIVAIMGHIDHGKSTLLDYIRSTKITENEAGGITQRLSAYVISVPYQNTERSITFLDTPGHAAFSGMRERGAIAADIAILIISAQDGVKEQTLEALKTIKDADIPFIVAINKIDRPEANIEKVKQMLAENEVLLEGYGGTIPWVAISALKGTGVTELLETILLVADLENMNHDSDGLVSGTVIETSMDPKRGISATIIIQCGTLKQGQFVVADKALTTTRIMENYLGKNIKEASPGTPVHLVGFDLAPTAGAQIKVFDKKRDAEKYIEEMESNSLKSSDFLSSSNNNKTVPLVLKADTFGAIEALLQEIKKNEVEGLNLKVIHKGVGSISEKDIQLAQSDKNIIILGFNVKMDNRARIQNETVGALVKTFDVIYKLTEWLVTELENRRPRIETRFVTGKAKVLKIFSKSKDKQVIGAKMQEGSIVTGGKLSIIRREFTIASGVIIEMQQAKQSAKEVSDGEFGLMIECKHEIAIGDILESFILKTI